MKITLVRHGKTDKNVEGIMQGVSNELLNDSGRRSCQRLRNELINEHFDICYMSPLVRCVETAMILVGDRVPIMPDKRLIERNIGEFEGKKREEYDISKYWDYNLNSNDNGVEPIQDVIKRCQSFLDYVLEKYDGKNVLIVTHHAIFKVLYYLLNNVDFTKELENIKVDNCSCKQIDIKKVKA